MNNFTASNGVRIRVRDAYLEYASGPENTAWTDVTSFALGSQVGVAVREFFQAEEDGRLGRWRWPEEPDYVVYPAANGCLVLLELAGDTFFLHRDFLDGEDEPTRAARAYFEAHPEPKPLPTVEGVYAMHPRVHLYERLIMLRNGQWLHLHTSASQFSDGPTAEQIARTAVDEGRLTLLTPEVSS